MQPLTSFAEFERFLGEFTNYERLQHFHYDKETLGIERIRSLVAELGDPQRAYPSVHIAGSKGKGSTSLLLESLLLASGYRVGTYTSPHVEHLTERVRVGGEPISEEAILRELNSVLPVLASRRCGKHGTFPSFFELMTALAMETFRHERVDWGVFEVGLGGRLDATNILEPRWTVITSIGLEHTAQLGSRLSEIAHEKAGIIKPGIDVFTGPMPSEAEAEIRRVAARKNARVVPVAGDRVRPAPEGGLYLEALDAVVPAGPVLGPALRVDLALALEVVRSIARDDDKIPDVTADVTAVGAALETLTLPARVEVFDTDPRVVLDSAHTTESLEALGHALEEMGVPRPRTVVFALSKGKELASILRCLPEIAEEIIFTHADEVRSVPPAELRDHFGSGEVIQRPEDAFARAVERWHPVIVTGSFFLSGRLRPVVRGLIRKT